MQNNFRKARVIAAGTAVYLILGSLQIVFQPPLGPFAYLFIPALIVLILPAPILSFFHLVDSSPWIGTWPNLGGIFVLLVAYTYVTYTVAKFFCGRVEKQ